MTNRGNRTALNGAQRVRLQQIIQQNFNDRQFKTLCFDLGVSFYQLAGETREAQIESLINYHLQRDMLYKLLDYLQKRLPKRDIWHNVMRAPLMPDVARKRKNGRLLLFIISFALVAVAIIILLLMPQMKTPMPEPLATVEPVAQRVLRTSTATATKTAVPTSSATPTTSTSATTTPTAIHATATPSPTALPLVVPTQTLSPPILATSELMMLQTVNIRQGPGTNYPVLEIIAAGGRLPIVAQHEAANGLWYVVALADKTEGWVSSRVSVLANTQSANPIPPVLTVPAVPYVAPANETPRAGAVPDEDDSSGSLRATPTTEA